MFKLRPISGTFVVVRLLLAPLLGPDIGVVVDPGVRDQFAPGANGDLIDRHLGPVPASRAVS